MFEQHKVSLIAQELARLNLTRGWIGDLGLEVKDDENFIPAIRLSNATESGLYHAAKLYEFLKKLDPINWDLVEDQECYLDQFWEAIRSKQFDGEEYLNQITSIEHPKIEAVISSEVKDLFPVAKPKRAIVFDYPELQNIGTAFRGFMQSGFKHFASNVINYQQDLDLFFYPDATYEIGNSTRQGMRSIRLTLTEAIIGLDKLDYEKRISLVFLNLEKQFYKSLADHYEALAYNASIDS